MTLYFLRHAIAVDRTEWKGSDTDRPLTKEGIKKMKDVARAMEAMDLKVDGILTSPYRRAYDTAVLAAKTLKKTSVLKTTKTLAPDGDPKQLMRRLALDYKSWESVLVVGHEPYLSRLISVLIAGKPDARILFKKAGLAKLTADSLTYAQCATLEWLVSPKLLKQF